MKCKQSLCSRTKNLEVSGNCYVCEDAIAKILDQKNCVKKKFENVKVDLNLMIDIQKKLLTGVPVDQQVVSSLLLGGIVNILNKHEVIDALEDEVESLKIDNQTNKARIESIENWLLKQDENRALDNQRQQKQ